MFEMADVVIDWNLTTVKCNMVWKGSVILKMYCAWNEHLKLTNVTSYLTLMDEKSVTLVTDGKYFPL